LGPVGFRFFFGCSNWTLKDYSSREQVEAEREVINVCPEIPVASSQMSKEAHAPHVNEVAQAQSQTGVLV
jgi:hypothetical protein